MSISMTKELKMNYRKTFSGALITFGVFASQMVLASQAPMGPQSGPAQTASPSVSHQGKMNPSADPATSAGTHSGKKGTSSSEKDISSAKGAHAGKKGTSEEKDTSPVKGAHSSKKGSSEEKEITPVKKELIDALKNQKESSLHCAAEGSKNHPLTPDVVEEKATKVKKKAGSFVVTLSSGTQVTCAK
jgi:hypothetical protein